MPDMCISSWLCFMGTLTVRKQNSSEDSLADTIFESSMACRCGNSNQGHGSVCLGNEDLWLLLLI